MSIGPLNKKQAAERVVKLRELINDYRYHYHVLDQSIMSEAAADSLKHELAELEERFPDLKTADSPTVRIAGEPLPGFSQVRHAQRMVSLNDVFNREEVEAWSEERSNEIELLKKNESFRKEFLQNLSHEFKTPVFAIQGYIDTLLSGALE